MTVTVRPRTDRDLPALGELLGRQQPASRYPFNWPLPYPVERFLVRDTEERTWVAEVDGQLAGHVSVTGVPDDAFSRIWSSALGRPLTELGCVSVLFTGSDHRGMGVGGILLDTAVGFIRDSGRVPVLDVVGGHSTAVDVYHHRGWRDVGWGRPHWLPDGEPDVLLMALD